MTLLLFLYDIIIILVKELFTQQKIRKKGAHRIYCNRDPDLSWVKIMYPVIFNILKEKTFKRYVKASFK